MICSYKVHELVFDWAILDDEKFTDEDDAVAALLSSPALGATLRADIARDSADLVVRARQATGRQGVVQSFLQEFSLDSREGLALMCLAEALLRTPDAASRDRLIAEQVSMADWASHLGHSESLFVNASTWGLMLTGKLIDIDEQTRRNPGGFLRRLAGQAGEPLVRKAMGAAMRIMGEQFILGRTIEGALERASRERLLCSFDMLGEGARTDADARRYTRIYADAIERVGQAGGDDRRGTGPEARHGVSVKLSALHPRFEAVHEDMVMAQLYPRLRHLASLAARHDIGLTIDAEEASRTVLSLKLVERLVHEPELGRWSGLGIVVQAYQKRATRIVTAVAELAAATDRQLMVRLVKGAYWDSEIKAAQVAGMADYPVFTTKPATDVSYLACAKLLLEASPSLHPQFATHNAHTLAAVHRMANDHAAVPEYQRLHGMGEALYAAADETYGPLRTRVYAPVGGHDELLPYLVRRLLENGANSSFVHRLLDPQVPPEEVARDPFSALEQGPSRHPRIPLPRDLYGPRRLNPLGRDTNNASVRAAAREEAARLGATVLQAAPIIGGRTISGPSQPVFNPADTSRLVGEVVCATPGDLDRAAVLARQVQPEWNRAGGAYRAGVLRRMAEAVERSMDALVALLAAEAGKTYDDGVAEVREAADFCRYYAMLAEDQFGAPRLLPGPVGEDNRLELSGRGTFACISPWNFPLAIFTGQIAAALAAGNAVLAKPAEQTPLIAAEAVRLFHAAGLDPRLLALLPGSGETIGAALIAHDGIDGVAFTGGTDTAFAINRSLAARRGPIVPFIAETGGLNAMFVDTTALHAQVIDDVVTSAFGSSGQRCSALRMLFVPHESANALLKGIAGALAVRVVGDPADPATDIGPVIDGEAKAALERHLIRLGNEATIVARHGGGSPGGHFFAPVLAEVDEPDFLEREVFGPVLHVCRYRAEDLEEYARRLAARGFGLTLGIHSRLAGFALTVQELVPAGNVYINRSMTGAVVGVQPFGGVGLSGTGPKAGGPHALLRFSSERSVAVNIMAQGGDPALLTL